MKTKILICAFFIITALFTFTSCEKENNTTTTDKRTEIVGEYTYTKTGKISTISKPDNNITETPINENGTVKIQLDQYSKDKVEIIFNDEFIGTSAEYSNGTLKMSESKQISNTSSTIGGVTTNTASVVTTTYAPVNRVNGVFTINAIISGQQTKNDVLSATYQGDFVLTMKLK